jgi:hypothetical protein
MIILALDIDGVCHPLNTRTRQNFCCLELLEAWLRQRSAVGVLISSSWREVHPLDKLSLFFSDDLRHRVVGVTPVFEKMYGKQWTRTAAEIAATRYQRQVEIERWMEANAPQERWVALDDDPSLFEPGCARLVVCDPTVELTQPDLQQLDDLLGGGIVAP